MHAIEVSETGGPEVLRYVDIPQPTPGPGRGAHQGRRHRRQLHRHLFPLGAVPTPVAVRHRLRGVRHGRRPWRGSGRRRPGRRRPGGQRLGERRLRRILHCPSIFDCEGAGRRSVRCGGFGAAEGPDRALPAQVGVSGAKRRHRAGACRRRRRRADPDAVGHPARRPGDHHRLDSGEGATVAAGRRRRGAPLPRRRRRVRRPGPGADRRRRCGRGLRRGRRHHVRRQPGQPGRPRDAGAVRRRQRARAAGRSAAPQLRRLGVPHPALAGPLHPHRRGVRWRAAELFDAIGSGAVTVEVGGRYPLSDAARAHEDLQGRKTTGSIVLLP